MKMNFWKVFLAALLAVVVGSVVSSMVWMSVFSSLSTLMGFATQNSVTSDTIVKIDFAENITEAPVKNPMAGFDYNTMTMAKNIQLLKVLQSIELAKNDNNVKGIYLNFTGMGSVTTASLEEIRAAIVDFKKSGKFVVAYNESYSQGTYYLASVADKIYLHPEGGFSWAGMANTSLFMKGTFDKLGIKAEAFRPTVCKYKSAVEPYIRKEMSPENRDQMQMMVDDMWGVIVAAVAESRSINAETLKTLADNLDIILPEDALKHNLVDGLIYEDQMDEKFADYGVNKKNKNEYNIISLGDYIMLSTPATNIGKPSVGIVYAEGQIFDGAGEDDNVYSVNLSNTLRLAREDDNIKAVVLRVNSPGGSALASDVIWREVELLRKEKPVIVSMGSYAASGGYYISSSTDAIVSNKLTLTGSIGVFGLLLEGEELLNDRLGITTDVVKTNKSADFGANVMGVRVRKISDAERAALLRSVDKVYETFTSRVANGRNLPMEKVLDLAQGRVWSGSRAVNIGLADVNGGMREAIAIAVDKAGIADNYCVEEVLEEMPPMVAFMQALNMKVKSYVIDSETLKAAEYYNSLKREFKREGVQAYCPYTFSLSY